MKIIKIGRDSSCNIQLEHDMISRNHAILRIHQTGKIELISMGTNGTKLNGILIRPNVVYKVKRSDMISFAGKYQLDWGMIPDPLKKYRIIGISLLICVLLGGLSILGYKVYDYFNPQVTTLTTPLIEPQAETEKAPTVVENEEPSKKSEIKTDSSSYKKNDVALSLEKIVAQKDSIKKIEEQEKLNNEKILNNIFPSKKKKAKQTKANSDKKTEKEKTNSVKNTEKETKDEKNTEDKEAKDEISENGDDIKSKLIH